MKNKKFRIKRLAAIAAVFCLFSSAVLPYSLGTEAVYAQELSETVQPDGTVIVEIGSEKAFQEYISKSRQDLWSFGKVIRLQTDLDLSDSKFEGVPYLCGVFEGNGHTVSYDKLKGNGSDYGFFRYIGSTGIVQNLKVKGTITAQGSQKQLGGIAGVNAGTIINCSFEGRVEGKENVGGIAGFNRAGGRIADSSSSAVVLATDSTGGIVGGNEGVLFNCISESEVNTKELKTTIDLGGVDIGALNLAGNVITRKNQGGIAGTSNGIISGCTNRGSVGFPHMGYNAGGITGSQSGTVLGCTNKGDVCGRKDVGGIVGQAEPYVESEYLSDEMEQARQELGSLSGTIENMTASLQGTADTARQGQRNLKNLYDSSVRRIEDSLNLLQQGAQSYGEEAQPLVQQIQSDFTQLQSIVSSGEEVTAEQLERAQQSLLAIQDNLKNLQNIFRNAGSAAGQELEQAAEQLGENLEGSRRSMEQMIQGIGSGLDTIESNISSVSAQMNQIADHLDENLALAAGGTVMEDISSADNAQNQNGVIASCTNYGSLTGDLNVGGIAGTINIETDLDPETDLDLTKAMDVTLRSVVNAVVLRCVNYGTISSKKDHAGAIAGLQEFGLIYQCEGYGSVESESGHYLGGIAGLSTSTIRNSYSLCSVRGTDYTGGICGSGSAMTDNISLSIVDGSGQNCGGVAGERASEGEVARNYFVGGAGGIDGINYAGAADEVSYEQIMAMEQIPEGFHTVKVSFQAGEKQLDTVTLAYGNILPKNSLPDIPEKEGYYAAWPEEVLSEPVKENLTVEAQYQKWTQSIASEENKNGRPLILMEGEFYPDTALQLKEVKGPDRGGRAVYAYAWNLSETGEQSYDFLKGHFYRTSAAEDCELWYKDGSTWKRAETEEDGSYLTARIPYGADVALVEKQGAIGVSIAAAALVILVLAAAALVIRKKKHPLKK